MIHKAPHPRTRGQLIPADFGSHSILTAIERKNQPTTYSSSVGSNNVLNAVNGKVMNDIVTPGYKQLSARGIIINNPMSSVERTSEIIQMFSGFDSESYLKNKNVSTGTVTSTRVDLGTYLVSDKELFPTIGALDSAYVMTQAINEAFSNAHQRNVMGLVDLAESGKTLNMLKTQCGRLESLVNKGLWKTLTHGGMKRVGSKSANSKIYRYKAKTPAGYAADAAGLHLELQYGVIPLMLSIEGLAKALAAPIDDPLSRNTFRGSDSLSKELSETATTSTLVLPGSPDKVVQRWIHRYDATIYARAGVLTRYKPTLIARLGLEARDIVPGIYELVPFSFVLDWVFDIGSYLEAVTPVKGFTSDSSWVTLYTEVVESFRYERDALTTQNSTNIWTCSRKVTEFAETSRSKTRIPGVVPQIPRFNGQLKSLTHFISGAAIVLSKTLNSKAFRKSLAK